MKSKTLVVIVLLVNLLLGLVMAQEFSCFDRETEELTNHIAGSDTKYTVAEVPWMVSMTNSDYFPGSFCGGSLINNTTVLTAAHCIVPDKPMMVRRAAEDGTVLGDAYDVIDYVIHPEYKPVSASAVAQNDIALLKLAEPVTNLSPSEVPRLLSPDDADKWAQPDDCAWVTGWGMTSDQPGSGSEFLLGADMPIWSDTDCGPSYSPVFGAEGHICSGYKAGVITTRRGDSGGPLIVRGGPTGYLQVGVVSFGSRTIQEDAPTVFTEVSGFYDWIFEAAGELAQQ